MLIFSHRERKGEGGGKKGNGGGGGLGAGQQRRGVRYRERERVAVVEGFAKPFFCPSRPSPFFFFFVVFVVFVVRACLAARPPSSAPPVGLSPSRYGRGHEAGQTGGFSPPSFFFSVWSSIVLSVGYRCTKNTLQRHPFSGLVHSAGELLHNP